MQVRDRSLGSKWKLVKKQRAYYLLALPGLVFFLIFSYIPMTGIVIAFKKYSIYTSIAESPWVGMAVFQRLFGLAGFQRALRNTIIISLYKLATGFPISVIIALMLNELRSRKFNKAIQTSIILPHFISWIVIYGLLYAMLSPNTGLIAAVYKTLLPGTKVPSILSDKYAFRALLVITNVWRNAGFASIMYTAAITGIDPSLYESAQLDGAGRWKQMLHVTLPCIKSTIMIMWILRLGSVLSTDFDQVLALQNPLVLETGDTLETFVYRLGLKQADYSLGTAAGLFKSAISLVLVLATNYASRRIDPDSALI